MRSSRDVAGGKNRQIPAKETSPMLLQYRRIKREHQGEVLFFRLGDFYEMFAEDALEISALLNLTLTSRNGFPMCGVPYHSARAYIARLLKLGKKIAVCEQISESGQKTLVERKVVEVITPGTTIDEDYLEKGSFNYLASLALAGDFLSFAYIDLSTADFYAASFPAAAAAEDLKRELERLQIRELVIQESLLEKESCIAAAVKDRPGLVLNRWADWLFDLEGSRKKLEKQFGVESLKGFGFSSDSPELLSAGALLDYLDDTAKTLIPHVRSITRYDDSQYVGIDESTQRNLELTRNLRDGDLRFSLLEVMDETRTAMGRRLLKRRILHPLRSLEQIQSRLDMVELFYRDQVKLGAFRDLLAKTPDLERLGSRIAMDKAHGKDMISVRNALESFVQLENLARGLTLKFESVEARSFNGESRASLERLRDLLERGILDNPSMLLTEGNLIRELYSPELDGLRALRDSGRQILEKYLEEEKNNTGITGLRIRYNRLIGYFFEVSKSQLNKVPSHFIRRQGIVTGERFSTERLAELESDINGASDKIIELEKKLFLEIREKSKEYLKELAAAARRIAELDTAQSLSRAASVRGWIRPRLDDSNKMEIIEGRHPVVEVHLSRGEFIPNDIVLDGSGEKGSIPFALITGPNMAGKSTYLRSAALITLMAQMGSFVSAREARIGLTDRIYCRVGASDNLARGESTFLVEMNETAYILHTATARSLVIMDEVGRGTGTNDGLSIAWAVCEDLLNRVKCRTLFATHYHELSLLDNPRLANRSMEVLDQDGEILFLRRLKEGPSAESYGLHVARLAGLSENLLIRAAAIMEKIRRRDRLIAESGIPGSGQASDSFLPEQTTAAGRTESAGTGPGQDRELYEEFLSAIDGVNPNEMTPLEALNLITAWKKLFAAGRRVSGGRRVVQAAQIKQHRPKESGAPTLFD
jgi:DNA mismatch repair protein MutS